MTDRLPGKLTRAQAIKLTHDALYLMDDYLWDKLMLNFEDDGPSLCQIFAALGVTREEYASATGHGTENWPSEEF